MAVMNRAGTKTIWVSHVDGRGTSTGHPVRLYRAPSQEVGSELGQSEVELSLKYGMLALHDEFNQLCHYASPVLTFLFLELNLHFKKMFRH